MEGEKTNPRSNADLWFAAGYIAALVVMYLTSKLSEYLASEAVVYTIPPTASQNGNESATGEAVTSLVKEYTENE